jgi:CheY-like chemotaxis protein/anti-anti-sigma regulatory factor
MRPDGTVIHFTGRSVRLDAETLPRIHDQMFAIVDESGDADLIFDFGNVEYVFGWALGMLVMLHKKLVAQGRHMAIGNILPQIHEVFTVMKLEKFLILAPPRNESAPAAMPKTGSPAGVLVVDDEAAAPSILAAKLRGAGCKVWLAADGYHAVELYEQYLEEIAVVVLNRLSPAMDALHTLNAIKEICPTVRCCFMTASTTPHTVAAVLQKGAAQRVQKPFPFTEVMGLSNPWGCCAPRHWQHRWIVPR